MIIDSKSLNQNIPATLVAHSRKNFVFSINDDIEGVSDEENIFFTYKVSPKLHVLYTLGE